MHFLERDEARRLEKKIRLQLAEQSPPKVILYYESGNRDYAHAANAITASIREFTEATMLFLWCISIEAWNEGTATEKQWRRYQQWRGAHGETRRLSEVPGHRFEPHEAAELSTAIEFALQLGWDGLLTAKPGRHLLVLSHDDRLEVYRGFKARSLAKQLIALGYWHQ